MRHDRKWPIKWNFLPSLFSLSQNWEHERNRESLRGVNEPANYVVTITARAKEGGGGGGERTGEKDPTVDACFVLLLLVDHIYILKQILNSRS